VNHFKFQMWTGGTWRTVSEGRAGRAVFNQKLDRPVRGRKFRLLVTSAKRFKYPDVRYVNISEFSLYGK
jgi:hypothetical protein